MNANNDIHIVVRYRIIGEEGKYVNDRTTDGYTANKQDEMTAPRAEVG